MIDSRPEASFTIGQLAGRTGCNIETIRYYERIGLMPAPARSPGGHRLFDRAALKRLNFIRRGRELGFSIDRLRGLLRLVDGGDFTCAEVQAITLDHLGEVRGKLADLHKIERVLADMAKACRGGATPDCPVLDALHATGR